jgi:hypothetical protein
MTTTTPPPVRQLPPSKRRPSRLQGLITRRRVVSSLALAIASALLVIGFQESKDGGTEVRLTRPAPVLDVFPAENASSLRQEPIGARLADEYTGEIEVDGTPIPVDQTERPVIATTESAPAQRGLSGLNQVSFTPGPGKDIKTLAPGRHTARILFWLKVGQTRAQAQVYSWTFSAT